MNPATQAVVATPAIAFHDMGIVSIGKWDDTRVPLNHGCSTMLETMELHHQCCLPMVVNVDLTISFPWLLGNPWNFVTWVLLKIGNPPVIILS